MRENIPNSCAKDRCCRRRGNEQRTNRTANKTSSKSTRIIAFAGRKQSGKTSSCDFINSIYQSTENATGKIYNFADPLKQLCIDILGLSYDQCYGTDENKNEVVDCQWPGTDSKMTAREVLQYVGTDVFRSMQYNVWAGATIRKIEADNFPMALIADCRFPNEVDAVKNAGGIVIKLNRNLYSSDHASERSLDEDVYDQSNFDFVVENKDLSVGEKNKIILNFLIDTGVLSF